MEKDKTSDFVKKHLASIPEKIKKANEVYKNNSVKFICTSEQKPAKNHLGEIIGEGEKRALYYIPKFGKHRVYRGGILTKPENWKLLEYSDFDEADVLCGEVNEVYGDDFQVEQIN